METTLVHFTVDADSLTDRIRTLWSEGEYVSALRFVSETFNGKVELQQAYAIISGKLKFEEIENTQEFILVSDNWSIDPNHCHLCQYPNPADEIAMKLAQDRLAEKSIRDDYSRQLHKKLVWADEMEEDSSSHRSRMREVQKWAAEHDPERRDVFFATTEGMDEILRNFVDGEKINTGILENPSKVKPSREVFPNGIITPDGKFYRCEFAGHAILAEALGYSGNQDKGWLPDEEAVQKGCAVVSANFISRKLRVKTRTEEMEKPITKWFNLIFSDSIPVVTIDY